MLQKVALLGMARILWEVFGEDAAVKSEGQALCPGLW